MADWSQTHTFSMANGSRQQAGPGPRSHAFWLGSACSTGGAFEGVTPDLDLHCAASIARPRRCG